MSKNESHILRLWYLLFLAATFILMWKHEPWLDELIAWRISKLSVPEIFYEMRFQGHFMPWHLLLYPFSHAGMSFAAMGFVSWTLNAVAVGYFLKKAPFVWWAKMAVTLSAPFLYWLPAISRCYVLIPLLLFPLAHNCSIIASESKDADKAFVVSGALLGLLANTHIYMEGFVLVASWFLFIKTVKGWKTSDLHQKRVRVLSLSLIAAGLLFAFLQVCSSVTSSGVFLQPSHKIAENLPRVWHLLLQHWFLIPLLITGFLIFTAFLIYMARKDFNSTMIFVVSCLFIVIVCLTVYLSPHAGKQFWFYIILFSLWLMCCKETSAGKGILYISIGVSLLSACLVSIREPLRDIRTYYSEESRFSAFVKAEINEFEPIYISPACTASYIYILEEYLPHHQFIYVNNEEELKKIFFTGSDSRSLYLLDGYNKNYDSDRQRFEQRRSQLHLDYEVLYPVAEERLHRYQYYLFKISRPCHAPR